MAKRTRPHVIMLRVNDAELALIAERMQQAGIINREAYLRRKPGVRRNTGDLTDRRSCFCGCRHIRERRE